MPLFGSHLSIAGSMIHALDEARRLGMDAVQVFTKNQQQWRAKPLEQDLIRQWRARVAELGWDRGGPDGRGGIVSHASYLINLASGNDELWAKSIDLMTDEIERCEALGIPYLVHHPGSFTTFTLGLGLARIADAYRELFRRTAGFATISCLEGTVGAGSTIGGRFEELAELARRIADATSAPHRVGFCLDTCHMHAAGYDMSSAASAAEHLAHFDRLCGLSNLKVVHINDSKAPASSRRDLHAHVGEGTIAGGAPGKPVTAATLAKSGFSTVVNHPALRDVPMILETPKGPPGSEGPKGRGTPWDTLNLRRLRRLLGRDASDQPDDADRTQPPADVERPKKRSGPARPKADGRARIRPSAPGRPGRTRQDPTEST